MGILDTETTYSGPYQPYEKAFLQKWLATISRELLFLQTSASRSSQRRCSVKKAILENFAKFTGKHL